MGGILDGVIHKIDDHPLDTLCVRVYHDVFRAFRQNLVDAGRSDVQAAVINGFG